MTWFSISPTVNQLPNRTMTYIPESHNFSINSVKNRFQIITFTWVFTRKEIQQLYKQYINQAFSYSCPNFDILVPKALSYLQYELLINVSFCSFGINLSRYNKTKEKLINDLQMRPGTEIDYRTWFRKNIVERIYIQREGVTWQDWDYQSWPDWDCPNSRLVLTFLESAHHPRDRRRHQPPQQQMLEVEEYEKYLMLPFELMFP